MTNYRNGSNGANGHANGLTALTALPATYIGRDCNENNEILNGHYEYVFASAESVLSIIISTDVRCTSTSNANFLNALRHNRFKWLNN